MSELNRKTFYIEDDLAGSNHEIMWATSFAQEGIGELENLLSKYAAYGEYLLANGYPDPSQL